MPETRSVCGRRAHAQSQEGPTEVARGATPAELAVGTSQTAAAAPVAASEEASLKSNTSTTTSEETGTTSGSGTESSTTKTGDSTSAASTSKEVSAPEGHRKAEEEKNSRQKTDAESARKSTDAGAPPPPPRAAAKANQRRAESVRSNAHARQLEDAREELLRLEIRLAKQKISRLEAEWDQESDRGSVIGDVEAENRVGTWLNKNNLLKVTDIPQQDHSETPAGVGTGGPPHHRPVGEREVVPKIPNISGAEMATASVYGTAPRKQEDQGREKESARAPAPAGAPAPAPVFAPPPPALVVAPPPPKQHAHGPEPALAARAAAPPSTPTPAAPLGYAPLSGATVQEWSSAAPAEERKQLQCVTVKNNNVNSNSCESENEENFSLVRNDTATGAVAARAQCVDLSELASAIALAARAGQSGPPRHAIELPVYYGSHQEWLSFRAAYEETVKSYSELENVSRLRRALRGRAKEAVENLLLYNASTADVMKTLESRFGRPDVIALTELERLRALPRPTDAPKDLCIFASRVSNVIATLKALKRMHYLYNPEATKITIEKLSPALKYRWYDFAAEDKIDEPDLLKLSRFLEREAERCSPYAQPEVFGFQSNADTNGRFERRQKTFTTVSKVNNNVKSIKKCPVCSAEGHAPADCEKYKQSTVDNRWKMAKEMHLCFTCLRPRSKLHVCKRKKCEIEDCRFWHHQLLHSSRQERDDKTLVAVSKTVASTWTPVKTQSFLKLVPVKVSGPAGEVDTYALLDDGSTVTLVDEEIVMKTGVTGPPDPLSIEAISEARVKEKMSRRVSLTLQGATRPFKVSARTISRLQLSAQSVSEEDLADCDHLSELCEELKYKDAVPKILIGQDNWHLLMASEVRRGRINQLVASFTPLGWTLHGRQTRALGQQVHYVNHMMTHDEEMHEEVKKFFTLESLTIEPKKPRNDPEERALALLKDRVVRTEAGYEAPLLWKRETDNMPLNYDNTLKRLQHIENKLDRDEVLKVKYNNQMNSFIEKGYAEPAPAVKSSNRIWYLPHFAVINPMKPDKMRIVHDAAAKTKGVSLNDHLLSGPDLLQSLPGVLMRFRQHPVAVSADIREMFMQVKVHPGDRDALRYLWRGDRRDDSPPDEYRMTSLIFGATCSPSIAIHVKDSNAAKHSEEYPEAAAAIVRNHYVDDYLHSFDSEEKAIRISKQVQMIHKYAHYDLRQWMSNSRRVLEALDPEALQQRAISMDGDDKRERTLGLVWKPGTDEIAFNLDMARVPQDVLNSKQPTKRQALKIVMSLFDPLGLAAVVTIKAKRLLQEVWRRGTGWDEKLDEDLTNQWMTWMKDLERLRDVTIPRCYPHFSHANDRQLHVFVDSSQTSYVAALYWRVTTPDGAVTTTLALAKAKVAPLKLTSIPRLELQAAVMGSRMATALLEEHDMKPESRTFWTDSRTVLAWIRAGARAYRPFVAHRIATIEENTEVNEWRWIPTKMNVADDATREVPDDLQRWFNGPDFLKGEPATWPTEQTAPAAPTGEEKTCHIVEKKKPSCQNAIPDVNRFSKWEKYLRATARVLQFIQLCQNKNKEKVSYSRTKKNKENDPDWRRKEQCKKYSPQILKSKTEKFLPISGELVKQAELLIVRASQEENFGEELNDLARGNPPAANSRLRPLAVENVNGIIHLKTRIGVATGITEAQRRPPVLDGNHRAAKLFIDYIHRQLQHASVESTVNECRQHYHILRLRTVGRMTIHRCLPCCIRKTVPAEPPTGNHPPCRLAHHQRPFTYTGVDYFGPLTVTVGRGTQKRYVALFTCLTTRAVHMEVAATLTTDSAVMALRRMMARRGCPTEIWSDNGSNLRGTEKELRQALDRATQEEASTRKINFRFIPAASPFMGGAWERLIRSVKTALYAVLKEKHPSEETLITLLAEAEYTVNSRPLTHVSVDPADPEALTPNHFVLGGPARSPLPGEFNDRDLIGRATWRAAQRLADHFWARWVKEYLPELQYRREPLGRGPALSVGDVVLIIDNSHPRNTWPRGVVTTTYPGADGVVRAADVRTKGGVLRRPTKKLIVLPTSPEPTASRPAPKDFTSTPAAMTGGSNVQDDDPDTQMTPATRPISRIYCTRARHT